MQGWIKLYRELLNKPIWQCSTPEQKSILITLLLSANHEEKEWIWQGKKYLCKPGQLITSLNSLAETSGTSIRNVRTALKNFEQIYEFLTSEPTNKNTLVTILNWGLYQSNIDEVTNTLTSSRQATDKQVTTNKNDKKYKNVRNKELKNIYAEFVSMTSEEYQKLISQFGEDGTKERIDRLNLYKGSTGKKYSSDYMTILNWSRKEGQCERHTGNPEQNKKPKYDKSKILYNGGNRDIECPPDI